MTTEQFYIYVPGGAIKRIKGGKKDIAEALPDLSVKINEFVAANSLKLKSEGELTMLVEALNNPVTESLNAHFLILRFIV